MSKKLAAYFSASGVTRKVAEILAEAVGSDLYEIRPQVPYTKADLYWQNKNPRSSLEMGDKSSRPALADKNANVGAYSAVFIGFPIWWYVAPTIINTFLERYDFTGREAMTRGLLHHQERRLGALPAGLIEETHALAQPPSPWDVDLARS